MTDFERLAWQHDLKCLAEARIANDQAHAELARMPGVCTCELAGAISRKALGPCLHCRAGNVLKSLDTAPQEATP